MSRPISGKQAVGIVLTLIIGVVLAIAVSSGSRSPPTDHTTSPTVSALVEAPPIAVTTTELEAAYGINTVAADDRFKGKRLLVRGVVQDINTDISNDVYIVFATSEVSFSRPQAHLASSERSTAAQLRPGQTIQLLCVGNGDVMKAPILGNCVFSNGAPATPAREDVRAPQVPLPAASIVSSNVGYTEKPVESEADRPLPLRFQPDKPATLQGKLQTGVFDNCCIDGNATKQQYWYLKLEHSIALRDLGPDAKAPNENLDSNIQLGAFKSESVDQSLIGKTIVVKCTSLYEGNTGHYATEAYCQDAAVASQ